MPRTLFVLILTLAVLHPGPASPQAQTQSQGGPCTGPYRDFDFWVGEWDVLNRNRPTDESTWYDTGMATARVYPVVAGCAIVEHWRGNAYGSFIEGFSLRSFNPNTGQWELALLWPTDGRPRFGVLRGGFRHNRGEFFSRGIGAQGDTTFTRFTFSDITPQTVLWQDGNSADGGRSWSSSWIMEFTRREPLYQGPLLNGPAVTNLRCPGDAHRGLDFLIGEWSGLSPENADEETGVGIRANVHPILDGCGVMERVQAMGQNEAWEVFRVRSFEPARERWVEYRIDSRVPWLQRLEAETPAPGEPWVFQSPGTERREQDLRVTLTRNSNGTLSWTEERWSAEAGQWRLQPGITYLDRLGQPSAGPEG